MKGQPPSGPMKETFMEHEVEKNIFFLFLALQSRKELKWDDLFRHHLIWDFQLFIEERNLCFILLQIIYSDYGKEFPHKETNIIGKSILQKRELVKHRKFEKKSETKKKAPFSTITAYRTEIQYQEKLTFKTGYIILHKLLFLNSNASIFLSYQFISINKW